MSLEACCIIWQCQLKWEHDCSCQHSGRFCFIGLLSDSILVVMQLILNGTNLYCTKKKYVQYSVQEILTIKHSLFFFFFKIFVLFLLFLLFLNSVITKGKIPSHYLFQSRLQAPPCLFMIHCIKKVPPVKVCFDLSSFCLLPFSARILHCLVFTAVPIIS